MTHQFPIYQIKGKTVEYKTFSFLVKSVDQDQGIVTGLASPVTQDRQKDIVEPGAYAQTLSDGQMRMQKGRKFMLATLWMHIPEKPTGGMIAGQEMPEGLDVTLKYDISTNAAGFFNNPTAAMVFSGAKVGYADELSVGYIAVKYSYDKQNVRHIQQMDLIEISGVTMGFAAHPDALITGVKTMATKTASGSTTLPLAPRDTTWDGSAAHNRVVDMATKDDGSLDADIMKQVHFWFDESAPENIGSYKLIFGDVMEGKLTAVPKGIFGCAGAIQGARGTGVDIPDGDVPSVKKKIESWYSKMAKEYDDDSIKPSWEDDNSKRGKRPMQRKDFNAVHQAGKASGSLDGWCNLLNELTETMFQVFGMSDTPESDMQACLTQFGQALMKEWLPKSIDAQLGQYLNDRGYCDPSSSTWVPYSMQVGSSDYGYMSRQDRISGKVGATISKRTQGALEQHQDEMKSMLDDHQKMMAKSVKAMQDKVGGLAGLYNGQSQDDEDDQQQEDGDNQQDDNSKSILTRSRTARKQQLSQKSSVVDMALSELEAMVL